MQDVDDVLQVIKREDRRIGNVIKIFFRHISIEPANLMILVGVAVQVCNFLFLIFF